MKPTPKKQTIYITNHAVERISNKFFHTKQQNSINFLFKWLKGFTNPIWIMPDKELHYLIKLPEGVNLVLVFNEKHQNYVVKTALTRREIRGSKLVPHGHLRLGHVLFAKEQRRNEFGSRN